MTPEADSWLRMVILGRSGRLIPGQESAYGDHIRGRFLLDFRVKSGSVAVRE